VRFHATVHPDAMTRPLGVQGHHAVVWKNGRAWPWALFRAEASDLEVRRGIEALGGKAGENLTVASWTERENRSNNEPDKRVEGSVIEAFVRLTKQSRLIPLAQIFSEQGMPAARLDLRYGGNERHRDDFKSGCIICLYSCPGGAIGNRIHPVRDYVRDGVTYRAVKTALPGPGSRVEIILKVHKESP